ncbi:MAG: acetate/propionate family kinase [Actinobacteria bacterium]|nr:acetate/propionate family kinase [Actinomycetota bacterium]
MIIGIGNVGSTSLKSKIIDIDDKNEIRALGEANLDKIKSEGESNFTHSIGGGNATKEVVDIMGFEQGIKLILDWYIKNGVINEAEDIEAMGFKCVLGEKNGANMLTPGILDEMRRYLFVAPVHNTPYIETIGEFRKVLGNIPMVGVFEPSFHYSISEYRKLSGFPWKWYEELGIKKNGFHGSSHRYLSAIAFKLESTENIKLLTIHLGGSSSICAVKGGKSVDTSMSFSPNSGLLQGTRVGDIDGTALLFAMKELRLSIEEAQDEISKNAGLYGTAGIGTDDLREILKASDEGNRRAKLAIDLFVDGIRKYIGAFSTVLGGIECMVFGGGIGEKGALIREKCLEDMEYMGIKLDLAKNRELNGRLGLISSDYSVDSSVKIYIVPTNEELVVAYFTKRVVEEGRDLIPEEMVFRL